MPGPHCGKCASPLCGPGILMLGLASNEGLGFFGEGQEMLNTFAEATLVGEGGVVHEHAFTKHVGALVRLVLLVALHVDVSPVFAQSVKAPSSIETPTPHKRQVVSELDVGNLDGREVLAQDMPNSKEVARPLARSRVETRQGLEDGGTELTARYNMAIPRVTLRGQSVQDEPGCKSAGDCKQPKISGTEIESEGVHPSVFVWLALAFAPLLPCFWRRDPWGGSKKPNVRAKRATTAGRQARAGENVPRTAGPGLVACRWRSA